LISGDHSKKILVVSAKKEAEPTLGQLRAAGHQVSLVEDMDEAQALLASEGFNQALLPARTLASLLEQRALWDSADMDAWRRSASGIAHDIRALLRSVDSGIRELAEGGQARRARDELTQARRTISVLSTFLAELTEELEGAFAEGLSLTSVNVEDAVETAAMAVYPSALERGQRLVIDVEEEVTRIEADGPKLKRVLTNLLQHASRSGPERGMVTVRARKEREDCVVAVSYAGDTITLSELRRLFAPPSPGGGAPGAGLSRVQRLVGQHGGRLWVESQKGSDTCIFVSLPMGATASSGSLAVNV